MALVVPIRTFKWMATFLAHFGDRIIKVTIAHRTLMIVKIETNLPITEGLFVF